MPGSTQLALLAWMVVPALSLRIQDSQARTHVLCKICPPYKAGKPRYQGTWTITERKADVGLFSYFSSNITEGCKKFQVAGPGATCSPAESINGAFALGASHEFAEKVIEEVNKRHTNEFYKRVDVDVDVDVDRCTGTGHHCFDSATYNNWALAAEEEVMLEELKKKPEDEQLPGALKLFISQHKLPKAQQDEGWTCAQGYSPRGEEPVKYGKDGGASWGDKCVVVKVLKGTGRPVLAWQTGDKCLSSNEPVEKDSFEGISSSEAASRAAMHLCSAIFCKRRGDTTKACESQYLNMYCTMTQSAESVCKEWEEKGEIRWYKQK